MNKDVLMRIDDVSVTFGGFQAIRNLTLELKQQELRVIIGPNGAGKTTLLDIICGKTRPTSGHVNFRGKDLTRLPEYEISRLGIARKFQTPSIYDDLTVEENFLVALPEARGFWDSLLFKKTKAITDKINNVMETVYLSEERGTLAKWLSHGQKQWLEIGTLLIQDPEILMLDEPVAGMSSSERDSTVKLLNEISQSKTILIIEHDMEFVRQIARTVTVLHQGEVLCEGTMDVVQSDARVIEVYLGD